MSQHTPGMTPPYPYELTGRCAGCQSNWMGSRSIPLPLSGMPEERAVFAATREPAMTDRLVTLAESDALRAGVDREERRTTMYTAACDPAKLKEAYRYLNLIRNADKRRYGFAYVAWMQGGAVGLEPERGDLSVMGAQAVRQRMAEFNLWRATP